MGKISDAIEKAGRNKASQPEPQKETPAPEEVRAAPIPAQPEKAETRETPAQEVWDERLSKAVNEDYYLAEVFKILRSRILVPKEGESIPRTIMVTSVAPKEGKSFISANLGISLAQGMDQYCLLVNCDLRRPSLSSLFGMSGKKGLVDFLRDHRDLTELIQKTSVDKLSVLASGKPPANPAELLGSSRMRDLTEELSQRYDDRIIIFDSPPFQLAAESITLMHLVDCIILVVREGCAGRHQVKKLVETIGKGKLLGVVYNDHTTNVIERSLLRGYGSYLPGSYN